MTADLHPDTREVRPGACCGACPPIAGGGWDCTCEGNPRCAHQARRAALAAPTDAAADRPSVPRVGDTITTAEQLDALPPGSVVRDHTTGAVGVVLDAPDEQGLYRVEFTGLGNTRVDRLVVLYMPGEPSRPSVTARADCRCDLSVGPNAVHIVDGHPDPRPSVTDNARADGYCTCNGPDSGGRMGDCGIAAHRAEWAAGRAETTTGCNCQAIPCGSKYPGPWHERGGEAHYPRAETTIATTDPQGDAVVILNTIRWCASGDDRSARVELDDVAVTIAGQDSGVTVTVTASTEDALREQVDRAVGGVLWNASNHPDPVAVLGKDTGPLRAKVTDAVLGTLAAARTRPTETEWRLRYPDGSTLRVGEAVARDPWPYPNEVVAERREVTAWTEVPR